MTAEKPIEDIARYPDGSLKFTGLRIEGEMHGDDWTWYRRDGSVMRTGAFEQGRQIGTWRTYDRDGSLVTEKDFGV